jgi:hypothetical protein
MELGYPSECPGPRARGGEMATKLYRVQSTKSDGTKIVWIALEKKYPPVRYAKAIEGLSADVEAIERQQHSVDELFTYEEAKQWLEYLKRHYGDLDSEIVDVALPLAPNAEALSYAPPRRENTTGNEKGGIPILPLRGPRLRGLALLRPHRWI